MTPSIQAVISQAVAIAWQVISIAFVLFLLAFVLAKFGVRQSVITTLQALELVYIAGIFWLARGGKVA